MCVQPGFDVEPGEPLGGVVDGPLGGVVVDGSLAAVVELDEFVEAALMVCPVDVEPLVAAVATAAPPPTRPPAMPRATKVCRSFISLRPCFAKALGPSSRLSGPRDTLSFAS
jgi:hypothetical protein